MAVANKGHISDFTARGGSKRTYIDTENIKNTMKFTKTFNHIYDYRACGAVAAGFVLDYLEVNFSVYDSWKCLDADFDAKQASLYERMGIGNGLLADTIRILGLDGDSVTLPWNLGCAIAYHSDYAITLSGYNYPKAAIEHNLPGISLRTFGGAGMHYRPVIAYKCNGWAGFSWPSFKILDLVDCSDTISQTEGKWETYIPVQHILNWNVLTKDLIDNWKVIFEAWGDC